MGEGGEARGKKGRRVKCVGRRERRGWGAGSRGRPHLIPDKAKKDRVISGKHLSGHQVYQLFIIIGTLVIESTLTCRSKAEGGKDYHNI